MQAHLDLSTALEKTEGQDLDNHSGWPHSSGAFYLLVLRFGPTGAILRADSPINRYFEEYPWAT
jgi:hypothetical protein